MKDFTLFLLSTVLYFGAMAQCTAPVITASGSTTLCPGGSVTLSAPASNVWTQKADFGGTARQGAVGFSIGTKGYIGTGYDNGFKKDFWEYDPATNVWTQKADFGGTARYFATGLSIGSKGYVGMGTNGAYYKDFWEYDPATNVWIQKANFGGTARYDASGISIGSKGYVGMGTPDGNTYFKDFWEYDPATNAWAQKTDFGGAARSGAIGFSIGSKGYTGTGFNGGSYYKDFWEFNPTTNIWAQKANFGGTGRSRAVGFSIGNKGYIGTGHISSVSDAKDFWEYDPATNTWRQKADFGGAARYGATGFSIGSKGYIGTGLGSNIYKDFWEYDPGYTYAWSPGGQTTSSIIARTTGNYTVTTTNALGCSATSVATVVTINTPATPTITASGSTTLCPGGSVTLSAPASNVWTQKAAFGGTTRQGAVGFSIGSKGYIGTGNSSGTYTKDFWEYNPVTNVWTQKADFGGAGRAYATGFSIGTKGYMGTGFNGSFTKDFWEYDPSANIWTQKEDFGGTARTAAAGFSIGSKGYIGTGFNGSTYTKDLWEYDPTVNSWTQKADFGGVARSGATSFSIGSKGYIGTGFNGSTYTKDFWEYDPTVNSWTQKADFGGVARQGAAGFSIGSKGYIGTGYNSGSYYKDFWEYNPSANAWTQKADVSSTVRAYAACFSIGSKGYIGTGYDGSNVYKDFWEYDPGYTYSWSPGGQTASFIIASTAGNYTVTTTNALGCTATSAATAVTINTPVTPTITASGSTTFCPDSSVTLSAPAGNVWTQKADFGGAGRYYATSFSIGSKGYIGTGYISGGFAEDFWEYDPATNIWTQKADFGGTARSGATGFSIGNKGYIGTGADANTSSTKDFWEYDPATNTWTQKADFGGMGRRSATGFSIGNKGYIGTGADGSNRYKDFWEYDPSTNVWTQKADFGGTARYLAASFSFGSKGYIGTGAGSSYTKDFWEYAPATNVWTRKADVSSTARAYATGFSIGSKGYIGTGNSSSGTSTKDFWEYDPGYTYAWSPGGQTTSSISATATGNYTVITTNALGCSATSIATAVMVNTPDTPVITPSGSLCPGGSVTLSAPASNAWTQKADFGGTGRNFAVSFSIGGKGYTGTGVDGNALFTKDFWEYDPATNVWTQKADFGGTARNSATGFSIGSKGYIGTGNDGSYTKDFWEYDPSTNAWTRKADFSGTGRSYAISFSIGSKGYIGTGFNGGTYYKDFWEYDPSANVWTQKADFGGTARRYAAGFSIGSRGYLGTGYDGSSIFTKDFWEYNPATNAWTRKADFGGAGRYAATGFSIGTKGYMGTGFNGSFTKDFWEYDPSANIWTQKADFGGTGRQYATGFSIGSKGYIGTGRDGTGGDGNYKKDFWEYDPGYTYAWSPGGQTTSSIIATATGNYTVTKTNVLGCSATSAATAVTANPATQITTQPQGTTTCKGSSVSFSVAATGSNLAYQWYRNGQPINNTSSALTISNAQVSNSGSYTVDVIGNCDTVTSDAATLLVYDNDNGAIYVDSSVPVSGNGTSWATAFKELREAMNAAALCSDITTINVAKGTYKPTDDTNRDSAFVMVRGGLKIYGGYPTGGGTRNISANATILSGDIGAENTSADNSYHVVIIAGLTSRADSVVLDGVTVTGGYADNFSGKSYNGVTVYQNYGAGICLNGNNGAGGKIAVRNSIITSNAAVFYGGGFYNELSSPTIANCVFTGNSSRIGDGQYSDAGGGLFNYNYSSPQVINCVFTGNNASRGGGVHNYSFSSPQLVNCTITANNCVAGSAGLFNEYSCSPVVTNGIIWGNTGASAGIYNTNNSTAAVTYSTVQDGYTGTGNLKADPFFVNAADADGADNIFGTGDDGLKLQVGSPAIDTGNNMAAAGISTDITGAARIQNSTVDMGAYEGSACPVFSTLYVDNSISTPGNGSSWTSAFSELRDALSVASQCSSITTINVAKGTYKPANDTNRESAFTIYRGGLKIYGGYPAGGGTRNATANPTILSGDIGAANNNTDNSYHVLVIAGLISSADSVVIDGFTIREGNAGGSTSNNYGITPVYQGNGGGVYIINNANGNKVALRNLIVSNNTAAYVAGGVEINNSSPSVANCTFNSNVSSVYGGGIFNEVYASPSFTNCLFVANNSSYGGGIYNLSSFPAINNCTFYANNSTNGGGAIYSSSPVSSLVTNSIVWGNTGSHPGIDGNAATITYSDVQGGYSGTGNINSDPLFINAADADGADNIFGTPDDGLTLISGSAVINTGSNAGVPSGITTDITGAARIQNGIVDMGAYESGQCSSFTTLYVDSTIASPGNGSSWTTAFKELKDALSIAGQCSSVTTINVAKGTYKPTNNANRDSAFTIYRGGLKIYGGYPSGGGTRSTAANPTILSGDIGTVNDSTDNSYHIIVIANPGSSADSLVIDGFTIAKANANGIASKLYNSVSISQSYGGGIYAGNQVNSKTVIRNCIISNNTATNGGGMRNNGGSSPALINCAFSYNNAHAGGGISNDNCLSVIRGCNFTGNNVATYGGGILNWNNSSVTVDSCTFSANYSAIGSCMYNYTGTQSISRSIFITNNASNYAGGVYNSFASPVLSGCTFSGNRAANYGGGIYNSNSPATISNCSFLNNSSVSGGGMLNSESASVITNCSFSNNSAKSGGGIFNSNHSAPTIKGCSFLNDSAYYGGGMFSDSSFAVIDSCRFAGNKASEGAGIENSHYSAPVITNSTFLNNISTNNGGGMLNYVNTRPVIKNCVFSENTATNYGGGISNFNSSSTTIINSVFSKNSALNGSAIIARTTSTCYITNCTFVPNTSFINGGFINSSGGSLVKMSNSVSTVNNFYNSGSTIVVTYSDVQGGYAGTGNINADPQFVNPADGDGSDNIWGTSDDGLRLQAGSPAQNTGRNDSIPAGITTDITGAARISNCTVDMGAYEVIDNINAYWTGLVSNDWNNNGNWCSGVPSPGSSVVIPVSAPYPPKLSSPVTLGNLVIATGTSLSLNNNMLTLAGTVGGAGVITGSPSSNMVINGSGDVGSLYFDPSQDGTTNVLRDMTMNRSSSGTVTLGNKLNLTGTYTPTAGVLNSNGYLNLKSNAGGTASVAAGAAAGGYITGNVVAERYTDGGSAASGRRAWRLLSSPVTGITIRDAWQEGQVNNTGYGTLITGEGLSSSQAQSLGFDYIGGGNHTSIKQYDSVGNAWVPLSTNNTTGTRIPIRSHPAYMVFVRGNRTITSTSGPATLRALGTLLQGTQTIPLSPGNFTLAGNPYASAIDFGKLYIHNSTLIQNQFNIWNSKIGTYGAYVLVKRNAGNTAYEATPAPFTVSSPADDYKYIPGGSGFFLSPVSIGATGTISIEETDKASGTPPVNPFRALPSTVKELRVNLNLKDTGASVTLADGFLVQFDNYFTDSATQAGASSVKTANFNENVAVVRNAANLIVDARPDVQQTDTLFMKLWYVVKRNYQFQVKADNFASSPGMGAWLEDSYLGTRQPVSLSGDITTINFAVTSDSLSWKSNRFRIVFRNNSLMVLPVTLTSLKAAPANDGVNINWTVTNEVNLKGYTVERSADDGKTYTTVAVQGAKNGTGSVFTHYDGFDARPKTGDNLYRIRIEAKDGTISYSEVVKVTTGEDRAVEISIYPNPAASKATVHINKITGNTTITLTDAKGRDVWKKENVTDTDTVIPVAHLANGSYLVTIKSSGSVTTLKLVKAD